jgi:hypothetical protein
MKLPSLKSFALQALPFREVRAIRRGHAVFAKRSLLEITRKPKPKRFGKSFSCPSFGVYLRPLGRRNPNSWLTLDGCVPGLGYTRYLRTERVRRIR